MVSLMKFCCLHVTRRVRFDDDRPCATNPEMLKQAKKSAVDSWLQGEEVLVRAAVQVAPNGLYIRQDALVSLANRFP